MIMSKRGEELNNHNDHSMIDQLSIIRLNFWLQITLFMGKATQYSCLMSWTLLS